MLLAIAISAALAPLAMSQAMPLADKAQPVQNQQAQIKHTFNITAGTLEQALTKFGQQAGIILIFSTELTRGVSSQGLQGGFSLKQGFTALLKDTNFVINKTAAGYVLAKKGAANQEKIGTLATAVVQSADIKDGSNEGGYISDGNTSVGVWQNRTLQETPYSINVVSNDLIKNLQATSTDQIIKINPVTQFSQPQTQLDSTTVYMRGFESVTGSRNGLTRPGNGHGIFMVEVEKVEILTGTSGFLYGAGYVGGMVNFVTKRSTEERLNSITLGNTSGSNMYLHGDFGGKFDDEGTFGYRINLLTQGGETAVKHQEIDKDLISLAFDWQVTDDLLVQVDASQRDYNLYGPQPFWELTTDLNSVTGKATRPDAKAIDNDKLWAQKWTTQHFETDRLGANLHCQLTDKITLRSAYLNEKMLRNFTFSTNVINADGSYDQRQQTRKDADQKKHSEAMFTYIDLAFTTGNIEHTITAGVRYSKDYNTRYNDYYSGYVTTITNASLSEPIYGDEPEWGVHGTDGPYVNSQTSYSIGDDMRFNEQWSALIGINKTRLLNKYYDDGEYMPDWTEDNDAITPTLSLIYQPTDNISTYITYMEALEPGGWVDEDMYLGKEVINYDATLDPSVSTQYELGAKVELGGMLLTTALFEIDKALEFYTLINNGEQAEHVQDGRQVHRGIEFTATGKMIRLILW